VHQCRTRKDVSSIDDARIVRLVPTPTRVQRTDSTAFDKFERTASGGLRVPAALTRVGVLDYQQADGTVIRELKPLEEVMKADSLATFEDAPVTYLHPESGEVTPANWSELAKGSVRNARADGALVVGDVVVLDGETIARIESRDLVEVSSGYTCVLDETPGVFDGQPYDRVQRSIKYNHAALGPKGWGRAGSDVALRLNSSGRDKMKKVRVDGIEYEAGSESHLQAVEKLLETQAAAVAERAKKTDELQGRCDGLESQLKDAKKSAAELQKRLDERASAESVDALVSARLALLDRARRVLGTEYELAGKKDREVMTEALTKLGQKVGDDASDDYLKGRFEQATEAEAAAPDSGDEPAADGGRGDSKGVRVAAGARSRVVTLDSIRDENRKLADSALSRWSVTAKKS
jgi:uncharacterized protein